MRYDTDRLLRTVAALGALTFLLTPMGDAARGADVALKRADVAAEKADAAAEKTDVAAESADLAREAASLHAVCAKCHNLEIVMNTPRSLDDWRDTMQKMVDRGASGSDDQYDDILDYLHRTATTIDVNSADADELGLVLGVSDATVSLIIQRRTRRKFADMADLKTIPGFDAAALDAKSKLIFFQ
jgi:competence protein ComEA